MTTRHGLAFGWLLIVMSLVLFAMAYAILDQTIAQLFQIGAERTDRQAISKGRRMAERAWTWAPLAVLVGAAIALIARAIFESAQPGAR
jgi:hypothetical protein